MFSLRSNKFWKHDCIYLNLLEQKAFLRKTVFYKENSINKTMQLSSGDLYKLVLLQMLNRLVHKSPCLTYTSVFNLEKISLQTPCMYFAFSLSH